MDQWERKEPGTERKKRDLERWDRCCRNDDSAAGTVTGKIGIRMMDGIVFENARAAMNDGSGIRTTVFLKGCPLRCV